MSEMTEGITPLQVTFTLTVDIDPIRHGDGLWAYELENLVRQAINRAPGLQTDPEVIA